MVLLITDLPKIMRQKEHWPVAAKCMERWFASPALEMSSAVKDSRVLMETLADNQPVATILTMDWAMTFGRVQTVFNALVGEKWRNKAAVAEIGRKIRSHVAANPDLGTQTKPWRFGDLGQPIALIDSHYEANRLTVGGLSDPLDDFYGAVGVGTLKVAISGMVTNGPGMFSIAVDKLGVYLRDTYDFNGDQPLGLWSQNGLHRNVFEELKFYAFGRRHANRDQTAGREAKAGSTQSMGWAK